MKLILGSDHAGFQLRQGMATWARSQGHEVREVGALSDAAYDYPVASDEVVNGVLKKSFDLGVIACGTGIGVSIRANRHPGIRAANCCSEEMARLAREHNHANVLCVGARILKEDEAIAILKAFVETPESTEARHVRRVELLDAELDRVPDGAVD
jgi:ribose 5-phosphate isomerase B